MRHIEILAIRPDNTEYLDKVWARATVRGLYIKKDGTIHATDGCARAMPESPDWSMYSREILHDLSFEGDLPGTGVWVDPSPKHLRILYLIWCVQEYKPEALLVDGRMNYPQALWWKLAKDMAVWAG